MRALVDEHFGFVERTLRKAGVPPSELDDETQRTFIAASRRIDDIRLGAERSFLFQVALNMAAHARRDLARRREVLPGEMPSERVVEANATPEALTQRKQLRKLLDRMVGEMDEALRTVFTLHEFDGLELVEIATRLGVPRGTAASRLRRARAHLRRNIAAIELAGEIGAERNTHIGEPAPLRRDDVSALGRALLDRGVSLPALATTPAKTLAVLGLATRAGF
jgi:RNA polymerase sigma-70 factor (ECF subfamily)